MKTRRHKELMEEMHHTYVTKNQDYGNSFSEAHEEFGPIAGLVQIGHKYNRLKNILTGDKLELQVKDESLRDTLMDLANYSILLLMEMENEE